MLQQRRFTNQGWPIYPGRSASAETIDNCCNLTCSTDKRRLIGRPAEHRSVSRLRRWCKRAHDIKPVATGSEAHLNVRRLDTFDPPDVIDSLGVVAPTGLYIDLRTVDIGRRTLAYWGSWW